MNIKPAEFHRNLKGSTFTLMLALTTTAQAASFDCTKADTRIEQMICSDTSLSKLDSQLGRAWKKHLDNNKYVDQFRATQQRWLSQRDRCADVKCLAERYKARLTQMASGREYYLRYQDTYPAAQVCEVVKDALNDQLYQPGRRRACVFEISTEVPGLLMQAAWEKLDMHQHNELYKHLRMLSLLPARARHSYAKSAPPNDKDQAPETNTLNNATPANAELEQTIRRDLERNVEFYRMSGLPPFPGRNDAALIRYYPAHQGNCPYPISMRLSSNLTPSEDVYATRLDEIPFIYLNEILFLSPLHYSPGPFSESFIIREYQMTDRPTYGAQLCQIDMDGKSISNGTED